jgi:polyhydroxybutyrate depolymerase
MMAERALSTALVLGLLAPVWGCGSHEDSSREPPQAGDDGPAAPGALSGGGVPTAPSTPSIPGGTATDPASETPGTPSLQQPPPVSSGSNGGSLPGSNGGSMEGPPPVSAPPAAACAHASSLAAGNTNDSIDFDGAKRTFIVHVPADLDASTPVPLVVDMHGLTSTAGAQAGISGWRAKADQEGFIVVHPQGLGNSWNGGDLCCGSSQSGNVDDEGFIRAMVAKLEEEGCIDPKRIYATGLSNGGAMSHLVACQAADLFAASAPVSMGNGTRPCEPSRPISVVMTRGTQDTLVSFNGGTFPSAQADFEQWAKLDNCQGEPEQVDELCQAFTQCDAGVEVKLCAIDAGHVLYNNRQNFSVPDTVWETFQRQTLP